MSDQLNKDITTIALMDELGKLSASEGAELRMYASVLEFLNGVGGKEIMRTRLDCLFDNCVDSVRLKKGRKSSMAIKYINELGIK